MAFQCQVCKHKYSKGSPTGACPACDSFDIKCLRPVATQKQKDRKTKTEIVIMVSLWSLLLYGIYDRFL